MRVCPFCKSNLDKAGASDGYYGNNAVCRECGDLVIPQEVPDVPSEEVVVRKRIYPDLPQCFSYYDGRDIACRRCRRARRCEQEFKVTRPNCFSKLYGTQAECASCLYASQCVEEMEMATKTKVRRRPRRSTKVKPVEEIQEQEQEQDYVQWSIPDLRAELEERELETSGRKSVLIKRLQANDDVNGGGAGEEPKAPVVKRQVRRTMVKKVVKEPVVEDEPLPMEAKIKDGDVLSDLAAAVLAALKEGNAITVMAIPNGYVMSLGSVPAAAAAVVVSADVKPKRKGLRGDAFRKEIFSDEYYTFKYHNANAFVESVPSGKSWDDLTTEEKYALAEEIGADWNEQDSERMDQMRMTMAVFAKLGIIKYKSQYESKAAREALR